MLSLNVTSFETVSFSGRINDSCWSRCHIPRRLPFYFFGLILFIDASGHVHALRSQKFLNGKVRVSSRSIAQMALNVVSELSVFCLKCKSRCSLPPPIVKVELVDFSASNGHIQQWCACRVPHAHFVQDYKRQLLPIRFRSSLNILSFRDLNIPCPCLYGGFLRDSRTCSSLC